MELKLEKDEILAIYEHGRKEYPRECVGVITGMPGTREGREVAPLTNKQDQLHEKDPEHFGRDARTGYFVDPKEVFELSQKVEREGKKILAFYHSHPDHDCYFSQTDHDGAVMWGEPVYPGAVYIIISVVKGEVKDAVVFSWDGKTYSPSAKLLVES